MPQSPHLRERISRKLDGLSDDRLYQLLDYAEFLESKYAEKTTAPANVFQRFSEGVEDTLRAGRVSSTAISDTMGLLNKAVGVLNGVAAAGKSVASDFATAASNAANAGSARPASAPPTASSQGDGIAGSPASTPSTPANGAPPPSGASGTSSPSTGERTP